ncbi:NFACT RNA binding domain-containing protein [Proteinivorax tanatarense]|uniref:Rqc2 homolog RqcH n=1 Tax=Proteinivorax tanatarense TaxID=1260629 RepID=A0AAU7VR42_9FIRM
MFDSLCTHALAWEYNKTLYNARIDKITQPKKHTVIVTVRKPGKNHSILLDASPDSCHTRISNQSFINPITPPKFCMLLRKYLASARIVSVEAIENERIINFNIQGRHPNGHLSNWVLSLEIMGKHSNLLFYDKDTNIILGALKILNSSSNSQREIAPNIPYTPPPRQNKITLQGDNISDLKLIAVSSSNHFLDKFLFQNVNMVSPKLAKEVVYKVFKDVNAKVGEVSDHTWEKIYNLLYSLIYTPQCNPSIFYDEDNLVDFYLFNLEHLNLKTKTKPTLNEAIDTFYTHKSKQEEVQKLHFTLSKSISSQIKKLNKKLKSLKKDLVKNEKGEKYKLYGELITANMHTLKKGLKTVTLYNYYDNTYIKIPLKASLTPNENSQRYFKKYAKAKRGIEIIKSNIQECENDLNYLNSVKYSIDISGLSELMEIKQELNKMGYLSSKDKGKSAKKETESSKPMKFVSSDNISIYVGKNNKQNDTLTLKMANPNDLWFHTKNIAGSHVVVRNEKIIPQKTIEEAAMLAAYYSKAKHSGNVEVDYTEIKNVRKPKKAKPGMVIYDNYTTVFVTPEANTIKNLQPK